jgi:hypothetical protein
LKIQPWWQRWPERLDWELAQLEALGMRHEVHHPEDGGLVRLDVTCTVDGTDYRLEVNFPQLYPYFRPDVRTAPGTFDFHQAPFSGGICLAARDPEFWSSDDSVAAFIAQQLPMVVAANAPDASRADELEEQAPEPVGEYYLYADGDSVLVSSDWMLSPEVESGRLVLGVLTPQLPLRAAVLEVRGPAGERLAEAPQAMRQIFSAGQLQVPWLRRPGAVMQETGGAFVEAVEASTGTRLRTRWHDLGPHQVDLHGIVYTDEVRYSEYGDAWVFAMRVRSREGKVAGKQRPSFPSHRTYLVRALRAGPSDLAGRSPQLKGLGSRGALVAGLGALGGPAAISLGRSGVGRINLLDHDFVDPATSSRWPEGIAVAGLRKAQAVGQNIVRNFPSSSVRQFIWRLGDLGGGAVNDTVVLGEALTDVELVLDATANTAVNHALADICWEHDLPYIVVSATAGAWGGLIARLQRGRTACWTCFNAALDGTIPLPPADERAGASVTPIACSEPTFTGAGFDLTPLSDEAVRLVVSTLQEGTDGLYPSADWDVETLALRHPDGTLQPPSWTSYKLPPNPNCPTGRCVGG